MYLSGSAAPKGSELDRTKGFGDSARQFLLVSECIVLIKPIHLAFGIPLLCFENGKIPYFGQIMTIPG